MIKSTIRFFTYCEECEDFTECTEAEFLAATGEIEYKRNTVFDNGVKQICLTKNPLGRG